MRVLIAYGSKRGGTAGLAKMIGKALVSHGIETDVRAAADAGSPDAFDAVIVAGALYMNRWHRHARRFVRRHARSLRARPVWLVSSGPLDDTARTGGLPAVPQVAKLGKLIGARGQVTFGGRLAADAQGFPASAMAKTKAGDWRDTEQIEQLAAAVAADLARVKADSP
jgi:menaquinone-dependent protoporphyrinogen oxidase